MRRFSTAALAIFIALVFLAYMVSFIVGYDETAVVTRFGKAGPDAVITDAGWHPRAPWPIDRVHTYPKQIQVLQDYPEEIQLPDGNTIIINMAVSWRISNPLDFFKSLKTIDGPDGADAALRSQMQNLKSVVTQYRFDELVNPDSSAVRMAELEQEVADTFQAQLDAIQPSYGIEIVRVSMGRLLYTQSTAEKVNQRMTATQQALAAEISAEGAAQAGTITSEAVSAQDIIIAFAQDVAQQIRTVGDVEAAEAMALFAETEQDELLAIFLRQIEAAEQIVGNRSTFVIDSSRLNPFNVYFLGPGEANDVTRMNEMRSAPNRPTPLLPEPTGTDAAPGVGRE